MSSETLPRIEIRLLGPLELIEDDKPVEIRIKKARLLLGYLVFRGGTPVSRALLAGMLWPDSHEEVARFNLRQLLLNLRKDLGPLGDRLVPHGSDQLRFDLKGCWVDLQEFRSKVKSCPGEAVALYRGGLLEGLASEWLEAERDSFQSAFGHLLKEPVPSYLVASAPAFEPVGGAVSLDSRFYVIRTTDAEFVAAVRRRESIVLLKGARQVGKTSLLARGLQDSRNHGAQVLVTDLQSLNEQSFASIGAFYGEICRSMAVQLNLDQKAAEQWDWSVSPNLNLESFIRTRLLANSDAHVLWALDEVDRLFSYPFGNEVFGLFRSWHNRRSLDPQGPWSRFTIAMAYATEAHLFISDLNQSPFNVGTRLTLQDFMLSEVQDLNDRYGKPVSSQELDEVMALTGGSPYLIQRALNHLALRKCTWLDMRNNAADDDGIFGDHLQRHLFSLSRDPLLCGTLKGFLLGSSDLDHLALARLRAAGFVSGEGAETRMRCVLYDRFFRSHLL